MSNLKNLVIIMASLTAVMAIEAPNAVNTFAYSEKGDEVVSYAESTEGVISGRPNVVTDFYGVVGEWCSMYIQFCASALGVGDKVPYSSYCDSQYGYPGGVDFFKERERFVPAQGTGFIPERSNVIYFDWDLDGYADHVGYVRWCDGTNVLTIEGNASDSVQSKVYELTSPFILGYGVPDYDGTGESFDPSSESYVSPLPDNGMTIYTLSSSIGAWARSEPLFGENKLGIVSTGSLLYSDQESGDWVHFESIPIDGETVHYSGWINKIALTAVSDSENIAAPEEIEIPSTAPETTDTPPTAEEGDNYSVLKQCYISSSVGAWLRNSMDFSNESKILVLDTAQAVDVFNDLGEWLYVGSDVNGTYYYGYIHYSTISGETYTPEIPTTYVINSPIGANFRQDPQIDDSNILAVLDCGQAVDVLSISGEWAFATADVCGYTTYGYIHTSCL